MCMLVIGNGESRKKIDIKKIPQIKIGCKTKIKRNKNKTRPRKITQRNTKKW